MPIANAGCQQDIASADVKRLGAYCADGVKPGNGRKHADCCISLAPATAPPLDRAANSGATSRLPTRQDVSVLLGGCGDARHFYATFLDAGNPARSPDATQLALRVMLNDHTPEVVARAYVCLVVSGRGGVAAGRARRDPRGM